MLNTCFLALLIIFCLSISAFTLLIAVLVGITSSAVGLQICTITARIKKYKSVIKEKKCKHDKILLGKAKLDRY